MVGKATKWMMTKVKGKEETLKTINFKERLFLGHDLYAVAG